MAEHNWTPVEPPVNLDESDYTVRGVYFLRGRLLKIKNEAFKENAEGTALESAGYSGPEEIVLVGDVNTLSGLCDDCSLRNAIIVAYSDDIRNAL